MDRLYFEEIEVGFKRSAGPYKISKDEIIAFAKQYDPMPRHIDENVAASSVFKGLTASSAHTFSILILLAGRARPGVNLLAGLGWDELKLPSPVRPDDELSVESVVIEKRLSESRPDRGIVRSQFFLRNQAGDIVLQSISTVLVGCRPAA